MSNIADQDYPIDPFSIGGTELCARMNRLSETFHSRMLGQSRPPALQVGGMWVRTGADGLSLMLYDGSSDSVVANWDTAGEGGFNGVSPETLADVHNPARSYKHGDIIWSEADGMFMSANQDIVAGPFDPAMWGALPNLRSGGLLASGQTSPVPWGISRNHRCWQPAPLNFPQNRVAVLTIPVLLYFMIAETWHYLLLIRFRDDIPDTGKVGVCFESPDVSALGVGAPDIVNFPYTNMLITTTVAVYKSLVSMQKTADTYWELDPQPGAVKPTRPCLKTSTPRVSATEAGVMQDIWMSFSIANKR